MIFNFTKFKYTDDFFYKKSEEISVERIIDLFKIVIPSSLSYSGIFWIESVIATNSEFIVFRTLKCPSGEFPDFEYFDDTIAHFIKIDLNGRKISIFRNDLSGIILKN